MNVCKFNAGELKELDQVIKRKLRAANILGNQASDEGLSKKRRRRAWTKVVDRCLQGSETTCCMLHWLLNKDVDQICMETRNTIGRERNCDIRTMEEVGIRIKFEDNAILIEGEQSQGGKKPT